MIVPMKRLTLLCLAPCVERTLEALRDLSCAHLDASAAPSAETAAAEASCAEAEAAVRVLAKAAADLKGEKLPAAPADEPDLRSAGAILAAAETLKTLTEDIDRRRRTIAFYEPFGDFDPDLAREILAAGVDLSSVATLPEPLPPERLGAMRAGLAAVTAQHRKLLEALARAHQDVSRLTDAYPALQDRLAFSAARDALESAGPIAWICGWVPQDAVPALRARAVREGWGLALRDPQGGETPPTLIRPPKLFRAVTALFDGLGIAPAYVESDVSVPFMCYFSLFFAMLVGDGAYGAIFLAATLWGWRRTKPREGAGHRPVAVRSALTLMTVFSVATVGWGLLSNTWFGAALPFARDWPTVRWLADPSYGNMMFLCFTIGVSHLMLARIWSALCLLNDRTCLAQFGWAGILLFMYLVTNAIVGIFPGVPAWAFWMFGVSLVLVFGFTLRGSELKTRGIELGMLPLNVMSALGDIISYVRLFAVGLASVQVASNFNDMAVGLFAGAGSVWTKALMALAMAAILLVGHGLNLAMAGLSILVHAVRLNTLEFSNHKGVSWAGYAFRPFRRRRA